MTHSKETLESMKYPNLVKLAKQLGVYRRYAPKAELVEKILSHQEPESVSDVSMPSFMEQDIENSPPTSSQDSPVRAKRGSKTKKKESITPHAPLRERTVTLETTSTALKTSVIENKVASPQVVRRSLAGPARQVGRNTLGKQSASQPRKLRRERTFDVEKPETPTPPPHKLKREGTFDVEVRTSLRSLQIKERATIGTPSSAKVVRQVQNRQSASRCRVTPRSGQIEYLSPVVKTSASKSSLKSKVPSVIKEIEKNKTEVSAKKLAVATGEKLGNVKKAPDFNAIHKRLFGKMESLVDSRQKVIDRAISITSQQKNQRTLANRKPESSKVARKLISPKVNKSKLPSPKPVFRKIASRSPIQPNAAVSKLPTPKPFPQKILPAFPSPKGGQEGKPKQSKPVFHFQANGHPFASKVNAIQKRPSVGSTISGITKLQSPSFVQQPNQNGNLGAAANRFGFTKAAGPPRKEALKAAIMDRKPLRKVSSGAKTKNMLQTVRLNKRFELQMKHRMAQQSAQ